MASKLQLLLIFFCLMIYLIPNFPNTTLEQVYQNYKCRAKIEVHYTRNLCYSFNTPEDFDGFNNETGCDILIVPNIVHFIRYNLEEFSFIDVICVLAAVKNQKPDRLLIHTNVEHFKGKYWEFLLSNPKFKRIHEIHNIELPKTIFGQMLSEEWHVEHASDFTRLRVLMKFGGIYLDTDTFLVQSLDRFRKFEMTLNWDEGQWLGSQTLISHPKSRFLVQYLESYRDNYRSYEWYYNGGQRPTETILFMQPYLVHRVKGQFGADTALVHNIFSMWWGEWTSYFCIHLLINHREYLDPENYKKMPLFNETNVLSLNLTIGFMIRDVLQWNTKTINES